LTTRDVSSASAWKRGSTRFSLYLAQYPSSVVAPGPAGVVESA
jgi:hypothetical protein